MSLLEKDTIKKRREFSVPEFEPGNDKEYKVEAIWNNAVYTKEANGHLLELYNLVTWKSYLKEKKIFENLFRPLCISERWLAPSTETIRRSRQQHQYLKLYFTHGQANNLAKIKARATDKIC